MFLSNVPKRGEIAFPYGKFNTQFDDSWSECGKKFGLEIKPNKGDALLFYNLDPIGTQDIFNLHTSCSIVNGIKWFATKWLHVHPFDVLDMDIPKDFNTNCSKWAKNGECTRNVEIMVGDAYRIGLCKKSCICTTRNRTLML